MLRSTFAIGLSLLAAALMLPSFADAGPPIKLVALGDSLTAGFGLPPEASFPSQLQMALQHEGLEVEVSNAGVSGDTVADGLARLDWAIPEDTDAVIVELGANDALRGLDPSVTRKGLDEILKRLKARGIPVLLAGMLAPRNLGEGYARAFDAIFPELATEHGAILYPFFLEGVAADASLNQPDGLHPTAAGVSVIVEGILPLVQELIAKVKRAG